MLTMRIIQTLWLCAAILQFTVACVVKLRKVGERRPAFAAFIYYQAIVAVLAWAIYGSPAAYLWLYYFSFGMTAALTLLVGIEAGRHTFGPRIYLPRWFPVRMAGVVGSAAAMVAVLDLLFAATNGSRLLRAMVTTEQGLTLASLAVFVVVIGYSRKLGIIGNQHTQKIMAGFVLYLSVNVLAVFIRGSAVPAVAVAAALLGMGAYCVSLVYWAAALWRKEELPARLTVEETSKLTAVMRGLRESALRQGMTATK
jgi:hypothetical protein